MALSKAGLPKRYSFMDYGGSNYKVQVINSMKDISHAEVSRRGGKKTFERHGSSHYERAGKKGREVIKKKDPDFYQRLSALGVAARKKKKQEKESDTSIHLTMQ